ncbi:D-aminoacylase [candidate division KSB1 bacterium]|nr:D-aminoacylase [candidate division KSB1 bacterium]
MKRQKLCVLISGAALLLSANFSPAASSKYELVIKNGRIVDGSGNPWFYADIGIIDGRIAKIGRIDTSDAAQVIDAQNLIVAPGFIDVHAHVENSIMRMPTADNFLMMGVTTIITGNCGGSWLAIGDSLRSLEAKGVSINLATLVGHNTVRRAVMKDEARDPSLEELEKMAQLVEQAMCDGAVGLSTGLIYIPGTFAKTDEIVALAKVAAKHDGIYASHIRNEGNEVVAAIKEAILIGETARVRVEISHFKISSKKLWGKSQMTVRLVREARERGLQVTIDQYAYPASSTGIETQFPDWVLDGGRDSAAVRLQDDKLRKQIKEEMIQNLRKAGRKDYSHAFVASYRPDTTFNGKSITEITKQNRGKKNAEAQAEQIIEMYLTSENRIGMVYHGMSEKDVDYIIQQPFCMVASDAGVIEMGRGVPHPRGYGNNARVLGKYVREKKLLGLEEAIRKMTSLPAQTFGFWDRGLIREGFAADLVIFDARKVADQATFENPHQYATGIRCVLVNGKMVVSEGKHTGARPGKILYGAGKS